MEVPRPRTPIDWNAIEDQVAYVVSPYLQDVIDRVNNTDDIAVIPANDIRLWKEHFSYELSDRHSLTANQLLTTHDSWLRTLENDNDVDISDFIAEAKHAKNFEHFMSIVFKHFTINQLASLNML